MKTPCTNCPWRPENHGKRTPWGFYTRANVRRLWGQIRRGGAQSCHPTDPNHPDHVAAGAKPGSTPQECAGSVLLILREAEKLAKLGKDGNTIDDQAVYQYLRRYPDGLSKTGIAYWILGRMKFGGVPFFGSGPKLPDVDQSFVVSRGREKA